MQLEEAREQSWTIPSFPLSGVVPKNMPAYGGPGMLPDPPSQQVFSGAHAHWPPPPPPPPQQQQQQQTYSFQQQMHHPGHFLPQSQHAQLMQTQRIAGPDIGLNSALPQQPKPFYRSQSSMQSQQLVAVLMQLLPPGEENAVAVSPDLDMAVQVNLTTCRAPARKLCT